MDILFTLKTLLICPDLSADCGPWPGLTIHQRALVIPGPSSPLLPEHQRVVTHRPSVDRTHPSLRMCQLDKKAFFTTNYQLQSGLIKRPIALFTQNLCRAAISASSRASFMGFFAFFCAEVRFEPIERIGQCLMSGSGGPGHEAERAERESRPGPGAGTGLSEAQVRCPYLDTLSQKIPSQLCNRTISADLLVLRSCHISGLMLCKLLASKICVS